MQALQWVLTDLMRTKNGSHVHACRGQCTHMLEDADAMKAHAQLHSTYNESAAKGRPVLHAALQAEKLVSQLVSWAAQMPLFAAHITGQHL